MPAYFAAAALAAFYLLMLPVKLALILRISPAPEPAPASAAPRQVLLLGASAFEPRLARRRARPLASHSRSRPSLPSPPVLRAALRAAACLLRRMRLEQLRVHGTLATGNAAATALLCGVAEAVQAACTPLNGLVDLHIQPDFAASASDLEAAGMIGLRAGHIICAALIFLWTYAAEACSNALKRLKDSPKSSVFVPRIAQNVPQIHLKKSPAAKAIN